MSKNTGDDELDDLFPTWFKKLQVTFSGELPLTKEERQQVFVIPYSLFEHAIKKYAAQEANKAQRQLLQGLMEQITKSAIVTLDTDPVGIDKVKNIPVGKFVRLNDVRAVIQKFINDSQAVS